MAMNSTAAAPGSGRRPGRFSDTYPLERRCIPFSAWPESDRLAFETARSPGNDAFALPGPAAAWARDTCRRRIEVYGRYLGFLDRSGLLLDAEGPAEHMAPDHLTDYIGEMRRLLSPHTLHQQLVELRQILQAMAPERDWRWITRHPGRPSWREIKASRKPRATFDLKLLCTRALDLMDEISAGTPTPEQRVLYRDALIVAMQCVFALRLRNLADMALGRNLIVDGDVIHLVFTVEETKNYAAICCTVPGFIAPLQQVLVCSKVR